MCISAYAALKLLPINHLHNLSDTIKQNMSAKKKENKPRQHNSQLKGARMEVCAW